MLETTYLTNHFLIAMPNLADPSFHQTVTYICMHNDEGAMGIIINRPLNVDLGDILEHMQIETNDAIVMRIPIHEGGPVQRERGFVLHYPLGHWEATMEMTNGLGITTSRDILNALAHGKGPQDVFIALGYAGWGAGQLEQEFAANTWLSTPADAQILFRTPVEKRWQAAAQKLGIDLNLLFVEAGHG